MTVYKINKKNSNKAINLTNLKPFINQIKNQNNNFSKKKSFNLN